jgi:hypothetical protein
MGYVVDGGADANIGDFCTVLAAGAKINCEC